MEANTINLHDTSGADRVRAHTSPPVQERLDQELVDRVRDCAAQVDGADGKASITRRIAELEQESDIERTLEINAAALAFTGTVLAAVRGRRWLLLPAVVTAFLLQHGLQGWCPPIAVFRRLGIRTRQEIDAERYALKVLRGDFDAPDTADPDAAAARALEAVRV
jgi:hypothetical protein